MNLGSGSIIFASKQGSGGLSSIGANNGLCIDTTPGNVGKVILGNTFASANDSAKILYDTVLYGNVKRLDLSGFSELNFLTQFNPGNGLMKVGNAPGNFAGAISSQIQFSAGVTPFNVTLDIDGLFNINAFSIISSGVFPFLWGVAKFELPIYGKYISTDEPGLNTQSSYFQFGKIKSGPVVLDSTNYIEISVDGVIKKLALVN